MLASSTPSKKFIARPWAACSPRRRNPMVDNLNLYGVNDATSQYAARVRHARQLLRGQEYERARGIFETTAWLNRSAYNELVNAFPTAIKTVMASAPAVAVKD